MAVSSFGAAAGGLQQYEQNFTSSGTWTKPTGVKTVEVTCVGGGSNGNSGGGGAVYKAIFDVSSQTTVPITVGASGGGNSSFGSYVTCTGGSGYNSGQWYLPAVPGKNYIVANGLTYTNATYISTQCPKVWNSGDGKYFAGYNQYVGGTYYYSLYNFPSSDGISFGYITSNLTAANWIEIWGYGAGVWVVGTLQNGQLPDAGKAYWTSPDGYTWTSRALPTNDSFYGMGYANGKWFAFPHYNTNTIYTSTDGYTWTSNSANMAGVYLKRIIYVNGYYWALGNSNEILYSSNGFNWTNVMGIGSAELVEHEGKALYFVSGGTGVLFNAPGDYSYISHASYSGISSLSGILVGKSGNYVGYSTDHGTTWNNFVTGSGNGVVAGIVNNKVWGWAYAMGGYTGAYNTVSGYFGQLARFLGNSYAGAGAAGPGAGYSGSYLYGQGIDGFGVGGTQTLTGMGANYGCGANSSLGGQGLVKVRWWA